MARPQKKGIDYFPLDTHMEESVEFIEAKHGLHGFAVVIKLWQKIYADMGYYCRWNERTAHMFAKKHGVDYALLCDIVTDCLKEGIFHKKIFEAFEVLTSNGIQKRFVHASGRRTTVEMELSLTINGVSALKNVVMVDTLSTKTPHIIIKDIKVKNKQTVTSAEEEETPPDVPLLASQDITDIYEEPFKDFWDKYPRKNGKRIGKADTEAEFRKLKPDQIPLVLKAVVNYAATERVNEGWGIRAPRYFFKKAGEREPFWKEWQEPEQKGGAHAGNQRIQEPGYDEDKP